MITISNPYQQQVHVRLVSQAGSEDGVHVQPGAKVNMPYGVKIHPNTIASYPKLRVTDDTPTAQVAPAAPVLPAPKTSK